MHDNSASKKISDQQRVFEKLSALIHATPGVCLEGDLEMNCEIADLGMDSLRLLEIVYELEKHFVLEVDEALLAEVTMLADIVGIVEARLGYDNNQL